MWNNIIFINVFRIVAVVQGCLNFHNCWSLLWSSSQMWTADSLSPQFIRAHLSMNLFTRLSGSSLLSTLLGFPVFYFHMITNRFLQKVDDFLFLQNHSTLNALTVELSANFLWNLSPLFPPPLGKPDFFPIPSILMRSF